MRPIALLLCPLFSPSCFSGEVESSTRYAWYGATGYRFTDVTASSGVALKNRSGSEEKLAVPEEIGQGAAAIDFDRDGYLDLFIANGGEFGPDGTVLGGPSALYRNLGGFRFEDLTVEAGLTLHAWAHGAYAVDFDTDGLPDLYVTVFGGPNLFYRNNGDGTFAPAGPAWGGADPGPSTGASFFDADGDGDLDLYVANFVNYDPKNPPNDGLPCDWKGLKVACGPIGTEASEDRFYENRDGHLVEATEEFGFADVPARYGLAVITIDYDDDLDVDVFVANDSTSNFLFENLGNRRFREVAAISGVDRNQNGVEQACMGVDFGDADNDGRPDLFVTNFSHDTNTLYRALKVPGGRVVFEDVTYRWKLGASSTPYLSWGTRFVDLDRDGWKDVVIVSGHIYPAVDDTPAIGTSYAQLNQVYRSSGLSEEDPIRFEEIQFAEGDAFRKRASSRGLVVADLDNDGDHDFLVVELDDLPTLIRNDTETPGGWIGFQLRGEPGNPDGFGTRVVVDAGGHTQTQSSLSGASYLSTCDPRLLFGLGDDPQQVRVHVRWPSGKEVDYEDLRTRRYWLLSAESSDAIPIADS